MKYLILIFLLFFTNVYTKEAKIDSYKLSSILVNGLKDDWSGKKIVCDKDGYIYWVGGTASKDFPVNAGGYSKILKGKTDAVVCKFDKDLKKIVASTYIGGNKSENGISIALDKKGNVYVLGVTNSKDFPIIRNGFDNKINGEKKDLFVAKFTNDFSKLLASTYIGGSNNEGTGFLMEIIINKNDVIIAGNTCSTDYPVTNNVFYQKPYKYRDNDRNVFISILNKNLSKLKHSILFGGKSDEQLSALKIDSRGDIFIAGHTMSSNIPVSKNGYKTTFEKGGYNIFVTKFNRNLSKMIASTYIGNDNNDFAYSMTVSKQDNVFICGHAGHNFPISKNAFNRDCTGIPDEAYIAKLDNNLSKILNSTFIGGGGHTEPGGKYCSSIYVDKDENVYVSGKTTVKDFPVSPNAVDEIFNGKEDVFVSMFNSDLSQLKYSTFLGGKGVDLSSGLLVENNGNIIISGYTESKDFPVTIKTNIYESSKYYNVFVSKLSPVKSLIGKNIFNMVKSNDIKEVKKYLINNNKSIKKRDKDKRTLLHWTAQYGYIDLAEFLINKININEKDINGFTALHIACMYKQNYVAKLLISKGADVSICDLSGNLPIHIASFYGNSNILKDLFKTNPNLEKLNKKGYTPLHLAVIANQASVTETLIKMGAKFKDNKNREKFIAKSAVLSCNNIKVIDILLKSGVDINTKDENGETLLLIAIKAWWEKTAMFLITKAGVNINLIDKSGRTPLFYAIENGFENLVDKLIKNGARLDIIDKKGNKPIDIAIKQGSEFIIRHIKYSLRKLNKKKQKVL